MHLGLLTHSNIYSVCQWGPTFFSASTMNRTWITCTAMGGICLNHLSTLWFQIASHHLWTRMVCPPSVLVLCLMGLVPENQVGENTTATDNNILQQTDGSIKPSNHLTLPTSNLRLVPPSSFIYYLTYFITSRHKHNILLTFSRIVFLYMIIYNIS